MAQWASFRGDRTALFGKWHLGFYKREFTPLGRGFDEHLGYLLRLMCIDKCRHIMLTWETWTLFYIGIDRSRYFTGVIDYYTHIRSAAMGNGATVVNGVLR